MKMSVLSIFSIIMFFSNLQAGVLDDGSNDPQILVALELAYECHDNDTAFTACNAALEKHKNDKACELFIKELMVRCPVSSKFEIEMQLAADYVVKNSSIPIHLGIAWFKKAENSYKNANFTECISHCDIALKNLGYDDGECSVEGNISTKTMFEILTLIKKKQCFEHLEQPTKIAETEKTLMNYPAYAKHIKETNK